MISLVNVKIPDNIILIKNNMRRLVAIIGSGFLVKSRWHDQGYTRHHFPGLLRPSSHPYKTADQFYPFP